MQPVGQRLAGGIQGLQLTRVAKNGGQLAQQPLLAAQALAQAGGELHDFLRAALALEIALERGDGLVGELQGLDLAELDLQEINLVSRELFRPEEPLAFVRELPPVLISLLVLAEDGLILGKQVQQLALAAFLQQAARFARPVEIDPVFPEFLQRRQRGHATVDGDLWRLVARQAALEDQDAIVTRRQVEFGEGLVQPAAVCEEQRRLDLGGGRALANDGLVGPGAREQRKRAEQDALAGAGLTGDRREAGFEIEFDLGQEGQIADAERLQDGSWYATASKDRTGRVVDAATGRGRLTIGGADQEVLTVAVRPGDGQIATSGLAPAVLWWDPKTAERVRQTAGPGVATHEIALDPKGAVLAAAGGDGTVRLYEPKAGGQPRTAAAGAPVFAVAVSPDGTRVASGGADGTAKVWDAADGRLLATLWSGAGPAADGDWLAITPEGYVGASDGVAARNPWQAGGKPVPDAKLVAPLRDPARVAEALCGKKVPEPAWK